MLLYKAWIETRIRFLAGLATTLIVCSYYLYAHSSLVAMWTHMLQDPKGPHFGWMRLAISDYNFYLWHYLYDNYLQQIWCLFAALFAFGGLIREKQDGTSLFSLGLPVSRRRWLYTRLLVALLEGCALAVFSVLVIAIGSAVIHQTYSLSQVLAHTALMVGIGFFAAALGNVFYTLFPSNYVSLILILAVISAPYLLIQTYVQHMRSIGRSTWLSYVDFGYAMAGPWHLTWSTVPWITILVMTVMTAILLRTAAVYGDHIDY
ncbi:ABC transporter permease [Terriglobus albidus]|uniref:ABC transporter permease n=1 Tax=Terriglobus albidus TaxID=1592106 RepID=UPI0021E0E485|nr:ABC transporter permease [Terriglobus albidus]